MILPAHLQGALMQQQSLALLLQLAQLGHVAGCSVLGLQKKDCAVCHALHTSAYLLACTTERDCTALHVLQA